MKILFRIVTLLGFCLVGTTNAKAIDLKFILPSGSVTLGNSIDVAIAVSGLGTNTAPSLGAFSFDVNFGNSLLQYQSTTFGGQLSLNGVAPVLQAATDNGTSIFLEESSANTATELDTLQAGEFTLATLRFRAIAIGNSPLTFANVILGDANGDPLTANLFGGSIGVIPATPSVPEPAFVPAVLVLAGIGVIGARGRRSEP